MSLRNYKSVSVRELCKYEANSRTHSDEQIEQIIRSINEFGFTNPLLIDEHNTIIAGHGRLEAALKLGLDELPCIVIDGLTEAQRAALVIADNKIALNAGWDNSILVAQFEFLKGFDFDLTLTGFGLDEICDFMPEELPGALCGEDDVPNLSNDCVSRTGDIWILGNHRLFSGDATIVTDVDRLMDGCIADMVFTDPPYGVNYQSNMRTKSKKFEVLKNDDVFIDFMPIVEMFSRGWVFVWTSWKVQNKWIELFNSFGYPSNMIVWHKPGGGIGDLKKTFSSDYELGLVWNRGAALCGKRIGSVWTINKDGSTEYKHPTQKPVELATEALDKCTKINANVLDLFGGSGTTLIACEKLKRKCYMMELDNTYIDVIIKRYQNYTGKEAIHEESGKTWNQLSQEMKMEVKT
jgi:DNA modification methylase